MSDPDAPEIFDVRYVETGKQRWLIAASILAGLLLLMVIVITQSLLESDADGLASWLFASAAVLLPAVLVIWLLIRHGSVRGHLHLTDEAWEFRPIRRTLGYGENPIRREWGEVVSLTFSGQEMQAAALVTMTRPPRRVFIQLSRPGVVLSLTFVEQWRLRAQQAREHHPEMAPVAELPLLPSLFARVAAWSGLLLFSAMAVILLFSGEMNGDSLLRLAVLASFVVPLTLRTIRRR